MSFPCLTDEAKGSFGEMFHFKTVVRTGVLGIYYWIEVRMESEEEHTGRQKETNKQTNKQTNSCVHGWDLAGKTLDPPAVSPLSLSLSLSLCLITCLSVGLLIGNERPSRTSL